MPSFKTLLRAAVLSAALSALCVVSASAASLGVGTVTADALRLRAETDTASSILATAVKDETVVVLEDAGDGWYRVDYKSVEGFMSADYLTVAAQADVSIGYGLVQTGGVTLNVRTGPGAGYDLVTALHDRTVVEIIGIDNGWYKISYKDMTGYVSSDYMVTCKDATGSRGDDKVLPYNASMGAQIVAYAQQFLGVPYVWGGNGPNCFDCSGFTKYVYSHFGVTLNRTATAQLSNGVSVAWGEWQPGDLIFFNNGVGAGRASHVGIYVGDGMFIHASTNTYAVQYSSLYTTCYTNTYTAARRLF